MKAITKTLVGESLPSLTCNYCKAVDGDLIAIMSSAIDKWNVMFGSYAQQMVKSSPVPLLSITPKEKQLPAGFQHLWRIMSDRHESQLRALMEAIPFASWFKDEDGTIYPGQ